MSNRELYAVALSTFVILNFSSLQGISAQAVWLDTRVVGGKDAPANSAPFVVSLQQVTGSGNVHYCGGTILNVNWVVTAAHCLSPASVVYNSVIIAGSIAVSGSASTAQKRKIDYYVVHDLYVGGTSPYDIGLVYTKTAFQWTSAVRAANLPRSGVVPTGTASLYGWGSVSTTSATKYPTTLQAVNSVPIVTLTQCENALGNLAINLHDTNICTGPLTGGVSICTSDSGGPLMQSNTLIGIISWGKIPCGQKNSPSVYVRVSAFNSWIAKNQVVPRQG